jgi:predicted MFS family arabinose efflux permease
VKNDLGIGDGQLAIAFVGLNAGAVAGLQLGGVLVPRLGSRASLRLAAPLLAVVLIGPGLATSLSALAISLFVFACANSVVDVGMNAQGVAIQERYGRPLMSSLHALQPLGLVVGSLVGAGAAHLDISPAVHLTVAGGVCALASGAATALLLPSHVDAERSGGRGPGISWRDLGRGWSRPILVLGVLAFCCTLADGAALEWTAVYLHDTLGLRPGTAALGFTLFALSMAVGRLTGDALTSRFGAVALFRAGVIVGGLGFGAALVLDFPIAGFAGVALLGAGLSYALPLCISAGGNLPGQSAGIAAARVSTLAYLGSFTGPAVIGVLAERVGLAAALAVPAIVVAATALGAGALAPASGEPAERPLRGR